MQDFVTEAKDGRKSQDNYLSLMYIRCKITKNVHLN